MNTQPVAGRGIGLREVCRIVKFLDLAPRGAHKWSNMYKVSIIVPLYNEQENIAPLVGELQDLADRVDYGMEMVFVNDGSTDATLDTLLRELKASRLVYKVLDFRKNFGQTAAMAAGIKNATGRYIVPIDGDLQNPPAEIPRMVALADEGYDIVSGWRRKRHDRFLTRVMPSRVANWLISHITGVKLHDYGCSLKVYKSDVIKHIELYGEMHRFLPALCSWVGAKITEVEVAHRPRVRGKSKYGLLRIFKVVLDLITVRFLLTFSKKPIYIFGGIGLAGMVIACVLEAVVLYMKFAGILTINRNPLTILGVMLFIMGVQFITLGLLAEMIVRTYYESQKKQIFHIKKIIAGGE